MPFAARLLTSHLRLIGPTIKPHFVFSDTGSTVSDGRELLVALRERGAAEHRLYLLWIVDHINLLAVAFADPEFLNASSQL